MKPPRFLGSRDFWFGVTLAALALVSVFLWAQNRKLGADTQAEVVRLCHTISAIDLAVIGPALEEREALLEFLPSGPQRRKALRERNNLQVAHAELSETTLCGRVS